MAGGKAMSDLLKAIALVSEARTLTIRGVRVAEQALAAQERMRDAGDWLSQLAPDTDEGKRAVAEWNEAREASDD
jgi:hypothetical protein